MNLLDKVITSGLAQMIACSRKQDFSYEVQSLLIRLGFLACVQAGVLAEIERQRLVPTEPQGGGVVLEHDQIAAHSAVQHANTAERL